MAELELGAPGAAQSAEGPQRDLDENRSAEANEGTAETDSAEAAEPGEVSENGAGDDEEVDEDFTPKHSW